MLASAADLTVPFINLGPPAAVQISEACCTSATEAGQLTLATTSYTTQDYLRTETEAQTEPLSERFPPFLVLAKTD